MEANLGVGFSYEEVFEMCQAGQEKAEPRLYRFPSLWFDFNIFLSGHSRRLPSWRERSEAGPPCRKCPPFPWTPTSTSTMWLIWRRVGWILTPWGKGCGSAPRCLWCPGTRSPCQNCRRTRAGSCGREPDCPAPSLSEVTGTETDNSLYF